MVHSLVGSHSCMHGGYPAFYNRGGSQGLIQECQKGPSYGSGDGNPLVGLKGKASVGGPGTKSAKS